MLRKINSSPLLTATLFFILIWTAFPLVALVRSFVYDISFAKAACSPLLIFIFVGGSLAYTIPTYMMTSRSSK